MSIELRCGCGKRLRVGDEMAGKRGRCPACKAVIEIPANDQYGLTEPQEIAASPMAPKAARAPAVPRSADGHKAPERARPATAGAVAANHGQTSHQAAPDTSGKRRLSPAIIAVVAVVAVSVVVAVAMTMGEPGPEGTSDGGYRLQNADQVADITRDLPFFTHIHGLSSPPKLGDNVPIVAVSMAQMRAIMTAMTAYAIDNADGAYPPALGTIAARVKDPMCFIHPSRHGAVNPPAGRDPATLADWVKANTDYDYVYYPGLTTALRSDFALFWERPRPDDKAILVVFGDKSLQEVPIERARGLIADAEKRPDETIKRQAQIAAKKEQERRALDEQSAARAAASAPLPSDHPDRIEATERLKMREALIVKRNETERARKAGDPTALLEFANEVQKLLDRYGAQVTREGATFVEIRMNKPLTEAEWQTFTYTKGVTKLDLSGSKISGRDSKVIAHLEGLRELNLSDCPVLAFEIYELTRQDPSVPGSPVTKTIERLILSGTRVNHTIADIAAKMPALKHIDLSRTQVTPAAIEKLRTARPDIEIVGP